MPNPTDAVPNVQRQLTAEVSATVLEARDESVPAPRRVHTVRKRLKRIRAILRLIRHRMDPDVYREESRWFRDRGQVLSAMRDAEVMVQTHDKLRRGAAGVSAGGRDAVLEALERSRDEAYRTTPPEELLAQVARDLEVKVQEWERAFPVLSPSEGMEQALAVSGARYERALHRAERSAAGQRFHALRKRVKDITYQLDFVAGSGDADATVRRRAARLGHMLGWAHDVQVYTRRLKRLDEVPKREIKAWRRRARSERDRTRKRALRRGSRFLDTILHRVGRGEAQAVGSPSSP